MTTTNAEIEEMNRCDVCDVCGKWTMITQATKEDFDGTIYSVDLCGECESFLERREEYLDFYFFLKFAFIPDRNQRKNAGV